MPAGMDPDTEAAQVADLVAKVRRRIVGDEVDLQVLGRQLADHYGLPHPTSVEWSARMAHRWGSCSISSGRIRLSDRLIHTPTWVRDHVLLHELAHLVEPAHGPAFQALIERDPNAERAAGYLAALDHMADRGLLDWTRG